MKQPFEEEEEEEEKRLLVFSKFKCAMDQKNQAT